MHDRNALGSADVTDEQLAVMVADLHGTDPETTTVLDSVAEEFPYDLPTITTAGRYWVDDYGYPNREADFRILRRYSPYHNIREGVHYPPILAITADTDDRVVPGHSFKYISAMQHADPDGAPHLIRIETRAGHGSGKPTDKQIEEFSDMYAFIARFTGMGVPAPPPAASRTTRR